MSKDNLIQHLMSVNPRHINILNNNSNYSNKTPFFLNNDNVELSFVQQQLEEIKEESQIISSFECNIWQTLLGSFHAQRPKQMNIKESFMSKNNLPIR